MTPGVALEGRILRWGVEDSVDEIEGEVVADGDLLEEPDRDQEQRFAALAGTEARWASELRKEIARAHDGTGDEVREECDEREVLEIALLRLESAVDRRR